MVITLNNEFIDNLTEIQFQASALHLNPTNEAKAVKAKIGDEIGVKDYTTAVDQAVEANLKENLLKLIPGSGFLGEEGEGVTGTRYLWVVDPTDGTALFATNGEYYSSSIALVDRESNEVPFGSVFQPARDRQFIRLKGEGYWVREKVVGRDGHERYSERVPQPSQSAGEPELLIATHATSKHADKIPGIQAKLAGILEPHTFEGFGSRLYGVRDAKPASGSSALFMCDIANGERHGVVLYFQKAWDFAVGAMYAANAGCPVTVGTDIQNITGGDLERTIASCDKNTLVNIAVYANPAVQNILEQKHLT
jgi:fructose-1,6-bisphosphatase/inositol monophosphatase family enzyme